MKRPEYLQKDAVTYIADRTGPTLLVNGVKPVVHVIKETLTLLNTLMEHGLSVYEARWKYLEVQVVDKPAKPKRAIQGFIRLPATKPAPRKKGK